MHDDVDEYDERDLLAALLRVRMYFLIYIFGVTRWPRNDDNAQKSFTVDENCNAFSKSYFTNLGNLE